MITAKVIADSIHAGTRITTLELEYPRFIHQEFMTHRVFSRNASSSRAIPVKKMIDDVLQNPAMPVYWGANRPGMQAKEELSADQCGIAEKLWLAARDDAVVHATRLLELGLHKQICNRVLEPFMHIRVLVTSTEFQNFFELRDHPDAQPEIQVLAREMKRAIQESVPEELRAGQYHIPYILETEKNDPNLDIETLLKFSVARCARVSYLNHDNTNPSREKDLSLYSQLIESKPIHASPAEHQAYACPGARSGNFTNWVQYRQMLS